jgi:uracil-DNA glycosylase
MLSKEQYSKKKNWKKVFPENKVDLNKYLHKTEWKFLIDDKFDKINEKLSSVMEKNEEIYPYPIYVFNTFKMLKPDDIKVVFIGQDPYPKNETFSGKVVPQAMGLCFSVAEDMSIPSSLQNIFKNLVKYNHISKIPTNGNLEEWVKQGCFMLNTSLTVSMGQVNSHQDIWFKFTNNVIKYISEHCDHVVFVAWGAFAYDKLKFVDLDKHEAVIASHPSGLSSSKPMKNYPAFDDFDHFGKINEYLKKFGKTEIKW